MSSPIEDYALIGDGQTAALVNKTGAIDWLCWPQFDSDACFAALLGTEENGRWSIAPKGGGTTTRRYQGDTLILETDVATATGTVRLVDFMPIRKGSYSSVVRLVTGLAGLVDMHMDLRMRFDYGALRPWCEPHDRGLLAKAGAAQLILDSPVDIVIENGGATAEFSLPAGQTFAFVLGYSTSTSPEPPAIDPSKALEETRSYWTTWIVRFDASKTQWPEVVKRSLITLRAMAHIETGGLIAARPPACRKRPAAI